MAFARVAVGAGSIKYNYDIVRGGAWISINFLTQGMTPIYCLLFRSSIDISRYFQHWSISYSVSYEFGEIL